MGAARPSELVDDLVAVIGEAGYLKLAEALGGSLFYVPRQPGPDHPITRAIGPRLAAQMGEYFHGQNLVLPVGQWRRRAVIALHAEGLTGDEIAARLKMSRSYVFDVLAAARTRAATTDLFG